MPANISKTCEGYDIRIMRNRKYHITSVTDGSLTDKEKLEKAKKRLDEIKHNIENNIDDSFKKVKDHNGNELPKGIESFSSRETPGYKAVIRYNGKRREKCFTDSL